MFKRGIFNRECFEADIFSAQITQGLVLPETGHEVKEEMQYIEGGFSIGNASRVATIAGIALVALGVAAAVAGAPVLAIGAGLLGAGVTAFSHFRNQPTSASGGFIVECDYRGGTASGSTPSIDCPYF